ncbi:MAG: pyruvate, phosphate dikinase [Kofleriaceae bacterium]|nr:pyruvate, phosphate dikinase [Kofleriaceae bacterium]MBP9170977.1 pyruvate, phosphate dikinase [Kofleriaceae bacterium]MBP9862050.1 pyruvate, phosphate dikinase [Kofleriaceae bacterium]
MNRWVFTFGCDPATAAPPERIATPAAAAALLGGKGAGLAAMASLGVPVPPGFTLTTEVCRHRVEHGRDPDGLTAEVAAAVTAIGAATGTGFGDATRPLLVSVRSGAPVSMPGMMDTVLNLGLNPTTVAGLAARTGDARFAWDCYRRLLAMYGEVVLGVGDDDAEHDEGVFERLLAERKYAAGVGKDSDLSAADLEALCGQYHDAIRAATGAAFPDDVHAQLAGAIDAVFRSWGNPRADAYRRMNGISAAMGTGVTVQAMVFGNLGESSATGVAFTRDPASGAKALYGEFLVNAQGEDVVAGVRTPEPIAAMEALFPEAYAGLVEVSARLEAHHLDMQDLEFTVQDRKLWMLQSRAGKRTGKAMVKIAVDQVREGLIDTATAIRRLEPHKLDELLHPTLDPKGKPAVLTKGLPASPGAAIGTIVFSATEADEAAAKGARVILVRTETSPEDIVGMKAAVGILTARGGMTSHAAVVARGMGKPCITGASGLRVEAARGLATVIGKGGAPDRVFRRGDTLTIDGGTGEVFAGPAPLAPAALSDELAVLMTWVDAARTLRVRTNADTPADARTARAFGAEGIGLCRTEHMFFAADRILAVREMILASDLAGRQAALAKILPMQEQDFREIFTAMDGLPVTIRLLDPPLHEFLPHGAEVNAVAADLGTTPDAIVAKVAALTEANPMLGHRGCRLAVTFPEIYQTQAVAIARAAIAAAAAGVVVHPEIMIPLVMVPDELARLRALVAAEVDRELAAAGVTIPYTIGTMIELPRACLVAGDIAAHADFFSFGTNDLTQTALGLSRDDVASFLPAYLEGDLLPADPFVTLDTKGVGQLIELAVARGRAAKPGLKVGVCGEHGGDPASVGAFHRYGLDYVSCSPFRVPIARVAAARAALAKDSP